MPCSTVTIVLTFLASANTLFLTLHMRIAWFHVSLLEYKDEASVKYLYLILSLKYHDLSMIQECRRFQVCLTSISHISPIDQKDIQPVQVTHIVIGCQWRRMSITAAQITTRLFVDDWWVDFPDKGPVIRETFSCYMTP